MSIQNSLRVDKENLFLLYRKLAIIKNRLGFQTYTAYTILSTWEIKSLFIFQFVHLFSVFYSILMTIHKARKT